MTISERLSGNYLLAPQLQFAFAAFGVPVGCKAAKAIAAAANNLRRVIMVRDAMN